MCLLVIPFSVIVSCMDSIVAGKMYACLSTIGNLEFVNEENAENNNVSLVNEIICKLSYFGKHFFFSLPVVLLCVLPSYNSKAAISVLRLFLL